MWRRISYITGGDGCLGSCTPSGKEEAEGVAEAQADAEEEGPFLAFDPVFVSDVVGVCQERVEGKEGKCVDV